MKRRQSSFRTFPGTSTDIFSVYCTYGKVLCGVVIKIKNIISKAKSLKFTGVCVIYHIFTVALAFFPPTVLYVTSYELLRGLSVHGVGKPGRHVHRREFYLMPVLHLKLTPHPIVLSP